MSKNELIEKNEEKLENILTEDDTIIKGQLSFLDRKNEVIARKESALKRLDLSFNKHLKLRELKKCNLLAYWITDFSNYHDNEKDFDSTTLKKFKRGDIIKVNLGFNIGSELGGLHYCVVINKNDSPYSNTLNIVPLTSIKENKVYNKHTCVNLGNELHCLLLNKLNTEASLLEKTVDSLNFTLNPLENIESLKPLLEKLEYIRKIKEELKHMKIGSVAYIHQITTISKQRIFKTPLLTGIRLSNESLDLIDEKIKSLFTK